MIVYEKPAEYRGTIEVYPRQWAWHGSKSVTEWRWQCKSRNNTILANGGKGYKRRAGALNAIDAQYAAQFDDSIRIRATLDEKWRYGHTNDFRSSLVVPWRLVIHDRHGNIERIGAVY